ncbi:hypothetical protein GCM10011505_20430 [Tistrella bauzanensis]|uniref:Uncharacterized protein n=1 Tax=Tistrella bauzanensis TaxID=657419 RepID=A0ABQ1IJ86_9PROT|nr:hypothetical protein GCM10011505_20430 [Tistrella bauzanensis]
MLVKAMRSDNGISRSIRSTSPMPVMWKRGPIGWRVRMDMAAVSSQAGLIVQRMMPLRAGWVETNSAACIDPSRLPRRDFAAILRQRGQVGRCAGSVS